MDDFESKAFSKIKSNLNKIYLNEYLYFISFGLLTIY